MSRRFIELPDHGLWDEVKRTIRPLSLINKPTTPRMGKGISFITPQAKAVPLPAQHPRGFVQKGAPPPLSQLDRRTAQRLSRGQIEPDARLDLHGEGLETARMSLLHFLAAQRQQGRRFVLVITGKGASPFARHTLHGTTHFQTPERQGRLRREVPIWLHEDAFRLHAIGFQPAHPRHGGGGAIYICLRKSGHHA
jgi:DNA-nicking Smr family endonuclease